MKHLLTKIAYPSIFLIIVLEILITRALQVDELVWPLIATVTTVLFGLGLEYIIPQNPDWSYFSKKRGMRWGCAIKDFAYFIGIDQVNDAVFLLVTAWSTAMMIHLWGEHWLSAQPLLLQLLILFLSIDFLRYWIHRLQHRVPFLWRWHSMHHTIDGFTALRTRWAHPLDDWMTYIPEVILIVLLGFSAEAELVFYSFDATIQLFNHMNVRIADGWLSRIFMNQRYHIFHHSIATGANDTMNFCELLTLWDRVFGTFRNDEVPEGYQLGILPRKERSFVHQLVGPLVLPVTKL